MKKFILAFIMFFVMIGASLADSNVYITQSGAALDLDITLDGNANAVGAANDRTLLTGANLDVGNVDNPTTYINKKQYDWVDVDEVNKSLGDLKRKTKKSFKKNELEGMLVCNDNIPEYKPPMTVEGILKGLKEIQDNQSYYKER